MAISATTAWEVRNGGSDTANSGGFRYGSFLSAPSAPTVNQSSSGGTVAAGTYYCVVTYTDALGETVISGETSVTTTGGSSTITVTSPAASTYATSWSCYFGTTSNGPYWPQGTGLTIGSNRTVTTTPPTTGTQPRGVDYSVQDAAQISVSDAVTNGTTTVTSATAAFTGAHVGNVVKIAGSFYDLVSVTNTTTIVVDRTIGAASGQALILGGGFATPGQVGANHVNGNITFVKYNATAYTMGSSSNAAGGRVTFGSGSWRWYGYDTTRLPNNTDANRPILRPSANSVTMFTASLGLVTLSNFEFSNSGAFTSCVVLSGAGGNIVQFCKSSGIASALTSLGNGSRVLGCDISASTAAISGTGQGIMVFACDVHDGAGISIGATAGTSAGCAVVRCNVYNISNVSSASAINCGWGGMVAECNVYNFTGASGSAGIMNNRSLVVNCNIEGVQPASGNGYSIDSNLTNGDCFANLYVNCDDYNAKTAQANNAGITSFQLKTINTLTGSAYTNPAAGNFAPNNTPGAGAAIRGAAYPTTFPAGTTANYLDIGAAQHQDAVPPAYFAY